MNKKIFNKAIGYLIELGIKVNKLNEKYERKDNTLLFYHYTPTPKDRYQFVYNLDAINIDTSYLWEVAKYKDEERTALYAKTVEELWAKIEEEDF